MDSMNKSIIFIIFLLISVSFFVIQPVFAENKSLIIAARSYERIAIHLNQGDELEFVISVNGGNNDDINLIIGIPGKDPVEGLVYEKFNDILVAPTSGTYVFTFDNTISLISNKRVNFSYSITKNTYVVYVDKLPEWADYASSVMFEATEFWKDVNPKLNFYVAESQQDADLTVKWVRDFGQEHVGYAYGDKFLEVGLGDSNCGNTWNTYSPSYVSKIMKHEIGHILGLGHSSNSNDIMYPYATQTEYGLIEKEYTITERHAQFVPLCVSKQVTAMDYSITTDDPTFGFDVYFVSSSESLNQWVTQTESFSHYPNKSCFGEGYLSFIGTCDGVSNSAGLLIIMGKETTNPLTKIKVAMQEKPYSGAPQRTNLISNVYESEPSPKQIQGSPVTSFETQSKSDEGGEAASKLVCGEGTKNENGRCVPVSQTSGGGCLIATATYGSELAPQVQQLREIRDNSLLQTESGSAFMESFNQFYYSFSPSIADLERENPVFKEIVKVSITPLLTSLSLLNYVDMDSEYEVLGYGISLILLNVGMYFVAPTIIIHRIKKYV